MKRLNDLVVRITAMPFAILTLPTEDGTYSYYKSIFDEVDKRQTPWGKVMSDIAIQQLTEEESKGIEIKKPRKEKPRSQKARKLITQELTKLLKEGDKKGKIK